MTKQSVHRSQCSLTSMCDFHCGWNGLLWFVKKIKSNHECHFNAFSLSDPAQALPMPLETYLPTGMDGMVNCPLIAQPPLLRVDWTKDGKSLDLSLVRKNTSIHDSSVSTSFLILIASSIACFYHNYFFFLTQSLLTYLELRNVCCMMKSHQYQIRSKTWWFCTF